MGVYERDPSTESANLSSPGGPIGHIEPSDVRAVFEAVFASEDRSKHVLELVSRLAALFGDNDDRAFEFIMLCQLDPTARSEVEVEIDLASVLGPDAEQLIRGLRATYGLRLAEATAAWNENPSNWKNIWFVPSFQFTDDAWQIQFGIERFDGEQFEIVGPPRSFIRIASYLASQLAVLPTGYYEYDDESIGQYAEACEALQSALDEMRKALKDTEDEVTLEEQP